MARPDRSAGFLLIEVAVALVIVALALGYGFRSLSGALDRIGRDHRTSAALLLAQSTLDRVGYDIGLGQDDLSGSTKEGFSWLVQTAPYQGVTTSGTSALVGYLVRVTVAWKESNSARKVQLSTVRLAYRTEG